jgi:molybdenum cofactor cytidylyltransferase
MIFDELPVSAAEGCILAHSIDLLGRRLRKGVTLNKDHIDELTRAGITHISAARLQERDIAEDAAAVALAKALVPYPEQAGLRLSAAFTGRVNLIATGGRRG